MITLGIGLGFLVGLSLGLLGGGGSVLTVPILVYVAGFDPKVGIATSLLVVGTTALFGAASHWRHRHVNVRVAVAFGICAMLGSFAGSRLAQQASGRLQLGLFGTIMIVAAVLMFRGRRRLAERAAAEGTANPTTPTPPTPSAATLALTAAIGVGVGALTGFLGVGGGFLIVPALVLLVQLPMKEAIGTSLLVITLNTGVAFSGYVGHVSLPWLFLVAFTAVAATGSTVGASWATRVHQDVLRRGFAIFLMVTGLFVLYQNRAALLGG